LHFPPLLHICNILLEDKRPGRWTTMKSTTIPAEPGMAVSEIDTPALVIDLDVFENNIKTMTSYCSQKKINLRPHAKTHKSLDIAQIQMEHGAIGICCQKVSEAEIFVNGGIPDVFITNEIVGSKKIARLINLASQARVAVCVDNYDNIRDLSAASDHSGTPLNVFVEVDIGGGRCGVQPGTATVDMVRSISDTSHLHFQGLQVYHGKAQHIRKYRDRRNAITASLEHVVNTVSLLEDSGNTCPIISGAGTGSYPFETASGIYTELQCGSYIFMDGDYGSIQTEQGPLLDRFANSLFVVSSVMSTPTPGRVVCDAGRKAHSIDSGLPTIRNNSSLSYQRPSDEHGIIVDPAETLELGDKLWLIPGHCDPTVNLHDWYVGVRNSRVECLWPVSARGMIL